MQTKLPFSFSISIKVAIQKFSNFDNFWMYTDMTAATVQANKIVLNEVKDN